MTRTIFLVLILLSCVSCNKNTKKGLSLTTFGPNEYEVTKYPKLNIPEDFSLPVLENEEPSTNHEIKKNN